MAQAPAVPKLHRAKMLLRTELFGQLTPPDAPVASEAAALALRSRALKHKSAEQVTFLIPLVGPHHVSDWDAVTLRLRDTLHSFLRQDTPDWTVVICCQTRPRLPKDDRIVALPFDDPSPGNDKWRKLRVLANALPDIVARPGYVMSFDADDLLRQGTVAEMLSRQARGGYLVEDGLVMDIASGDIGRAGQRSLMAPLRKPFWKLCGSCAALYHDPAEPASTAFLAEMMQHEHRMFPYLARLAGQSLTPFHTAAVLYMLNHGENFGARRGRVDFKTRFVQRFKVTDADALAAIARDFDITT